MKSIKGNTSRFLLQFKTRVTNDTGGYDTHTWYLDSCEKDFAVVSACGRYINDPCSSYDLQKYPYIQTHAHVSKFTVNCYYCSKMLGPHPIIGEYYCEVKAKFDLEAGIELFSEYTYEYWKRMQLYYKDTDTNLNFNPTYDDSRWLKKQIE